MSKQITEADVDAALARMALPGGLPTEPDLWDLYDVISPSPTDPRFHQALRARDRVRKNYNRDIRSRGKHCRACGSHYIPKRVDQQYCPDCIQKQKAARGAP